MSLYSAFESQGVSKMRKDSEGSDPVVKSIQVTARYSPPRLLELTKISQVIRGTGSGAADNGTEQDPPDFE